MRSVSELKIQPVWLNSHHLVETARYVLEGHHARVIAVMEGKIPLGCVTYDQVFASDPTATLESIMKKPKLLLEPMTSVDKAAQEMSDADTEYALVMSDEEFLGIVTATMLLRELRRPWDARTGLGSGERLRDWGTEMLTLRQEISILFFDLNEFKKYNKEFGHLIGDRVLRRFATFLKDCIDPKTELLVRYGGDEFAIGTTRHRAEAEQLAEYIKERAQNELFDEQSRPITFCVGLSGGRRVQVRDGLHTDATFDDLLNGASRACMAAKSEMYNRRYANQQGTTDPYEQDDIEKSR